MPAGQGEDTRELRESSRALLEELRQTRRDGTWHQVWAVVLAMLLGLGIVVAAVAVHRYGPWEHTSSSALLRRQRLQQAAEKVEMTGNKLVSALATWSPSGRRSQDEAPDDTSSSGASGLTVKEEIQLGKDQAELQWMKRELKASLATKRKASESLAIERVKSKEQEKDMTELQKTLAQLVQEVKDREGDLASAKLRITKGQEALLAKEVENSELRKKLAAATRLAGTESQLASKNKKLAAKESAPDEKCQVELATTKEGLQKTNDQLKQVQQELERKKKDFQKFLGMLKGTWSQTEALKERINVLEASRVAEADQELQSDGGSSLSTKDKVLQLLGLVAKGGSSSSSSQSGKSGSSSEDSDW